MLPLIPVLLLTSFRTWGCAMQLDSAPPSVIDIHKDLIGNDMLFLLSEGPAAMQRWVPRMELCSKGNQGNSLVKEALEWYNGLQPQKLTCCVSIEAQQCLVVSQESAPELKKPHISGRPDASKMFVGVHRTFWACPEGFVPLLETPPLGAQDTCCSFFDPDNEENSRNPQACGVGYCTHTPSIVETAYCHKMPLFESRDQANQLVAFASGPQTKEDTNPETSCVLDKVELESGVTVDADKVTDTAAYYEACEKQNKKLAGKGLGKQCAYCTRKNGSPQNKCTQCSRVDRAIHSGWDCTSFAPDYPCGSKPDTFKVRTYQDKLDFAVHQNLRTALSAAEHITDYNDGVYRQNGFPSRTSPLRHRGGGAAASFGHGLWHPPNFPRRGEAEGTCGSSGKLISKLHLERDRDEPLQAHTDDFTADGERMEQVMAGLGAQNGLADVRSVLFPRVSAEADFSNPGDVAFLDAASHFFACSDSRATYGVLGTPGGDLAEFLLAMNVMERARQPQSEPLGDETIMYHFQEYLEEMVQSGKKHFFYCVGSEALQRWAEAAQVADPIHPRGNGEITRLVQYGVFPDHIGSAHLREMLQDPAGYRCRRGLVLSVVRAFLTVYYDVAHPSRGRLIMALHEGDFAKQAVLYVDRSSGYPCGNMAPMVVPVTPDNAQPELFVVHRAAVDIYRERLARFVVAKLGIPNQNEANIFQSMRDIGSIQLSATLKKLLPNANGYIAHFTN